ncbi:hypothetical protein [Acinetobacter populi]|uniref:DUF4376 domain-containing protein n=1 Tax=Acinetobacter populi TaxID=1582270 RepID=A0A1Z9Z2L7_9GAMM|nr:hypothetical protein [Acinetobacter populi]OUY08711.1 hypothetical protein CAP51_03610 [Acinetobacter populi]
MIKFSVIKQAFYDSALDYPELPEDLILVSNEQHLYLLEKINNGCIIFEDLSYTDRKPSQNHIWNGVEWEDKRSEEDKRSAYLASLKNLTRRQFKLTLLDFDLLDTIEGKIAAIEDKATRQRIQIEYTEALEFNRTSDSVLYMCQMLELTESQVDEMWKHAMQIPT